MSIKYIIIPEHKKTIAILHNTKFDLLRKINKTFSSVLGVQICDKKYMLNDFYKASVVCCDGDEYDEEVGKHEAKKKVMDKYHKALDGGYSRFVRDVFSIALKQMGYDGVVYPNSYVDLIKLICDI